MNIQFVHNIWSLVNAKIHFVDQILTWIAEEVSSVKISSMLLTTTNTVEGKPVKEYYGLVSGETIIGANIFRDIFASIRDIVGGRSGSYEKVLRQAKETAVNEMCLDAADLGANAVIGVDLDYETVGQGMLMVTASGTAVRI